MSIPFDFSKKKMSPRLGRCNSKTSKEMEEIKNVLLCVATAQRFFAILLCTRIAWRSYKPPNVTGQTRFDAIRRTQSHVRIRWTTEMRFLWVTQNRTTRKLRAPRTRSAGEKRDLLRSDSASLPCAAAHESFHYEFRAFVAKVHVRSAVNPERKREAADATRLLCACTRTMRSERIKMEPNENTNNYRR